MIDTPSLFTIFRIFLGLGLTSFGGPVAHIGYFRRCFVDQRKWITPMAFQSLFALCQMLPGPSSSQLGFALGLRWGGLAGGCLAFIGFTLPSAIIMIGSGYGLVHFGADLGQLIDALKLVTAAVVLHAVIGMARGFAGGMVTSLLALVMMSVVLYLNMPFLHPLFILLAGLIGMLILPIDHKDINSPCICRAITSVPVADLAMGICRHRGGVIIHGTCASGQVLVCFEPVLSSRIAGVWWWSCCSAITAGIGGGNRTGFSGGFSGWLWHGTGYSRPLYSPLAGFWGR
jgi:chromate transport protein ChrA